jgi:hypothetical protein
MGPIAGRIVVTSRAFQSHFRAAASSSTGGPQDLPVLAHLSVSSHTFLLTWTPEPAMNGLD